jgi:hypothetical protein
MDTVAAETLHGWMPVHVSASVGEPVVEWAIAGAPFAAPFFEQTVDAAMRHPFNLAFTRRTPLDALHAVRERAPGVAPAGLIFHMSRCGSTLISQMLSGLAATVVLSEPRPFDAVLRLRARGLHENRIAEVLRSLVSALAQARGGERHLFLKLHAWHVLELPLIARAFPDVPWIFVFREPRAVLQSQLRTPGHEVMPGMVHPSYVGLQPGAAASIEPAEYTARFLAALCEAALRYAGVGRSAFVAYDTLPGSVFDVLADTFGVRADDADVERMREIAPFDTKHAGSAFSAPAGVSRRSPDVERLAVAWLDAPYAALCAAASSRSDRSSR